MHAGTLPCLPHNCQKWLLLIVASHGNKNTTVHNKTKSTNWLNTRHSSLTKLKKPITFEVSHLENKTYQKMNLQYSYSNLHSQNLNSGIHLFENDFIFLNLLPNHNQMEWWMQYGKHIPFNKWSQTDEKIKNRYFTCSIFIIKIFIVKNDHMN